MSAPTRVDALWESYDGNSLLKWYALASNLERELVEARLNAPIELRRKDMVDHDLKRKAAIYDAAIELGDVYARVVQASRDGDTETMFRLMWDLGWGKLRDLEGYRMVK